MNQNKRLLCSSKKLAIISALLLAILSLYFIRNQMPLVILTTALIVLVIIKSDLSPFHLLHVSIIHSLLFVGPAVGWLYGSDALQEAMLSEKLIHKQWPFMTSGFEYTPLLHYLSAITSVITNIGLVPETQPKVLISFIVPIILVNTTVLISILVVRSQSEVFTPIILLPILFWIPLFRFHSAFRRETVGILLFIMVVYTLYSLRDYRKSLLLIIFVISVTAAHHLSLLLSLFTICAWYLYNTEKFIKKTPLIFTLLVIPTFWYIIMGLGAEKIFSILYTINLTRLNGLFTVVSDTQQESQNINLPNIINIHSDLFIFYNLINRLAYSAIIGVGVTIYSFYRRNKYIVFSFLYGIGSAFFVFFSWASGSLDFNRVISFYVIIAGWLPLEFIYSTKMENKVLAKPISVKLTVIAKILVIIFVVLGYTMIPIHTISSQSPDVNKGERSQRFTKWSYAVAEFSYRFVPYESVVADWKISEPISTIGDKLVLRKHFAIANGSIPDNTVVILSNKANVIYRGYSYKLNRKIAWRPVNLSNKYNRHSRIYDSGNVTIFGKYGR